MTTAAGDRLYRLLPALYRQRDAALGEPLRALLGVAEQELEVLEADIDGLYENWFIETCDEWVVAYLGDLLGVSQLSDEQHLVFSQRARVANTLRYRRRKGTIAALQDVVQDATGWHALAIEYFERLAVTQHAQHVRIDRASTIDVRDRSALERTEGPFDAFARRVDVRRMATGQGKHNISNVGVFVWRIPGYPLSHAGHPVDGEPVGRYMFDTLGRDVVLFTRPDPRSHTAHGPADTEQPMAIGRRAFAADLAAYAARHRGEPEARRPAESRFYGPQRSLFVVKDGVAVPPSRVVGADLGEWTRPTAGVAIDVERGRIAFAAGEEPTSGVVVSYSHGFSADLGGGAYDRRASLDVAGPETWHAHVTVTRGASANAGVERFATLTEAIAAWRSTRQPGLIEVLDSEAYELPTIEVPAGRRLAIQAIDGARPTIRSAPTTVRGPAPRQGAVATVLSLHGCLMASPLQIVGDLELTVSHCSVPSGISAAGLHDDLHVSIVRSIVGALQCQGEGTRIDLRDSIVDGPVMASVFRADRTTVLGAVTVREMALATESIFVGRVAVERRQIGAVRFSYVPQGSTTPPRFRCQPDLAVADADIPERSRIERRLAPVFTSARYGDPGFAQLSVRCAVEIAAGAEDGSEMGAFHHLHQPQRAAVLRAIVEEYLPLGLEAGVMFVS